MPEPTLSIALSPSSLGLAIFQGQDLTFLETHLFQAIPKPAEAVAGFVLRCIDDFNPAAAVMQDATDEPPEIRAAVVQALRGSNRPISEISGEEVLASFGNPPLESKDELRQLMRVLFPQIPSNWWLFSCLDAVAAGLHFETQRLLADNQ